MFAAASLRALGLTLALAGCETPPAPQAPPPPIATGPWLLEPAPGRITVAWTTQKAGVGRVWYGTAEPDRLASETGAPVVDHRVVLGALQPSTQYRYRIEGSAGTAWFESPPRPGGEGPIRAVVYGDNRGSNGDHALVARAAASERAQLLLHTGGMVPAGGDEALWRAWFQEERDLLAHAPILAAATAADPDGPFARYFQRRGMPAYASLDYGPVHVCVLDSSDGAPQESGISDAQRAWFEEDLRGLPRERHVWVLVHRGAFAPALKTGTQGGGDALKAAIKAAAQIHPVEAVFEGGAHFYRRGTTDGIAWFVIGAGGAPLEEPDRSAAGAQAAARALSFASVAVCGCHTSLAVKDIAGRVLDSVKLSGCEIPCGTEAASPPPQAPAAAVEPPDAGPSATGGSRRHSRRRRRSIMGLDGGAGPAENRPR
ncbi:MAG TPA: hypothetical protein VI356_20650 [Myxococcales bacterium]